MSKNGTILIIFAWAMEIVGVTGGIINSAYTTFGPDLPDSLAGYLQAVPMFALPVAELGRGLINAQQQPYGCKLDECEVVGSELVVAGCHTPTVLDLVEEPLDQVTSTVKIRTEA